MSPHDREQMIVAEATRYFAEHGFDGGTTTLATRIGVTQPLLFRYFPTKEALIERVYEDVFPGHWDPQWEELLENQSIPLQERLTTFYREYADSVLTYEYVRIFLHANLSRYEYNTRFYDILNERVFRKIAEALRLEVVPERAETPITDVEIEMAQSLHAAIYQLALRKWVHTPPLECEINELVEAKVKMFLDGARAFAIDSSAGRQPGAVASPMRKPRRNGA